MKIDMPMKMISRFYYGFLIAAFAVGVLNILLVEPGLVRADLACGDDAYRACLEEKTPEVNACGAACPLAEKPCLPGDPPGATCYGYDVGCLNACSSAAEQTCRTKTTCPPDAPKTSSPPTPRSSSPPTPKVRDLKDDEMGLIYKLTGEAEIMLPDGTVIEVDEESISIQNPLSLPKGATIFSGDETRISIKVRGGEVLMEDLIDFTLTEPEIANALRQGPIKHRPAPPLGPEKETPVPWDALLPKFLRLDEVDIPKVRAIIEQMQQEEQEEPTIKLRALKDDEMGLIYQVSGGGAEVQLPNGEMIEISGDGRIEDHPIALPPGAVISTGEYARVRVKVRGGEVVVGHLSYVTLDEYIVELSIQQEKYEKIYNARDRIRRELGEETADAFLRYERSQMEKEAERIRVEEGKVTDDSRDQTIKVEQPDQGEFRPRKIRMQLNRGRIEVKPATGEFQADMKIQTPAAHASPTGTYFGVAYDPTAGISIFEIYDGSIEVTHDKTGKRAVLASSYGEPIKRVEISSDGTFTPQIAIPGNEWREQQKLATRGAEEKKTSLVLWAIAVVGFAIVAGVGFTLYRRKSSGR